MKSPLFLICFLLLWSCDSPENSLDPIVLQRGDLSLTVDPQLGGRITSLKFQGREILQTRCDSLFLQCGSTAWTSPQSDWNWPPIATFDTEAYTWKKLRENVLLLESKRDPETLLRMKKRITLGPDSDVGVTYWVVNEGNSATRVAAWENTRLPYAGSLQFEADSIRASLDTTPVESLDSLHFIHFDERHTERQKIFSDLKADSVIYRNGDITLTKFTAITDLFHTPPGQAPLEVYFDPVAGFLEFELHGYYRPLEPGDHASLRTRWKVEAGSR